MEKATVSQNIARVGLGAFLTLAGISHLTFARKEFQAQVPDWVPMNKDIVVLLSGGVEISLGLALMLLPKCRKLTGTVASLFFVGVFPGNISQYTHRRNGFGLNTDHRRFARLFFQPVLSAWALYGSTVVNEQTEDSKETEE